MYPLIFRVCEGDVDAWRRVVHAWRSSHMSYGSMLSTCLIEGKRARRFFDELFCFFVILQRGERDEASHCGRAILDLEKDLALVATRSVGRERAYVAHNVVCIE